MENLTNQAYQNFAENPEMSHRDRRDLSNPDCSDRLDQNQMNPGLDLKQADQNFLEGAESLVGSFLLIPGQNRLYHWQSLADPENLGDYLLDLPGIPEALLAENLLEYLEDYRHLQNRLQDLACQRKNLSESRFQALLSYQYLDLLRHRRNHRNPRRQNQSLTRNC
ncbi:MAG: hypothetical protein ABEJ87_00035 [Candidatus Nanohalobium sp.]